MRRLWTEDVVRRYDGEFHTIDARRHQPAADGADPDLVRRVGAGAARALRPPRRRVDPARHAERRVARAAGHDPRRARGGRAVDGRLRHPGPGPVRRRRPGPLAHPRRRAGEELGATHLAIATHNAGPTDVDGHLARVAEYLDAVR